MFLVGLMVNRSLILFFVVILFCVFMFVIVVLVWVVNCCIIDWFECVFEVYCQYCNDYEMLIMV